jgi:prepilin-type N-terminal cleavage/methylation domain-containing protein
MLQKLNTKRGGFTLVEIMIVVAIIALLAAIAVPNFLRARKRSQATRILEDLRLIDAAIDQYAIETNKAGGASVSWTDIKGYLKTNSKLYNSSGNDLFNNPFAGGSYKVDTIPTVATGTFNELSDVAPAEFWSPFK